MLPVLPVLPLLTPLLTPLLAGCGWLAPVSGSVLEAFDPPTAPRAAGHRGIDLAASPGEAVQAPADGIVAVAGWIGGRPVLVVDTGGVRATLEPVTALPGITPGTQVRRGEVIGRVESGGSSHCADSCVHLGAKLPASAGEPPRYLDPMALMRCRPVLKPSAGWTSLT